jgi:effector-binding domain-containing protein
MARITFFNVRCFIKTASQKNRVKSGAWRIAFLCRQLARHDGRFRGENQSNSIDISNKSLKNHKVLLSVHSAKQHHNGRHLRPSNPSFAIGFLIYHLV